MNIPNNMGASEFVLSRLEDAGVAVSEIQVRDYPGEKNYIVFVAPEDVSPAAEHSTALESILSTPDIQAFVIVRAASEMSKKSPKSFALKSLSDTRVTALIALVSARSRVSAAEPSLFYVPNARASLSAVTAARHHLIFGRRGAGKTALLVEARRNAEENGAITAWVNIQTYRREHLPRVVLYTFSKILEAMVSRADALPPNHPANIAISRNYNNVLELLDKSDNTEQQVIQLVPKIHSAVQRFLEITDRTMYVFLDDFYYLPRSDQPQILDMLHGITRDTKVWLKVASIKHLTRSWISSPPTGLQTGQDAEVIDLDVSLQDPQQANEFLQRVLAEYARTVGIQSLSQIFKRTALDRLVLASGAVPRDYMVLAASSVARAQQRPGARQAGVQEVNQAAGDAAAEKINELEEDMASNPGGAENTLKTLKMVREFCLDQSTYTYFLVSFRDKEDHPVWYNLLTDLMDVRLIHLIDEGVSDPHSAGHRYEAFMLDLSQYSGARLKQRIHVLDFVGGNYVARQTRGKQSVRIGSTSRQLTAILRIAPRLKLELLSNIITPNTDLCNELP
ncbi:ATP-binding protein [Mycobacteroides abscessus]|uniref:ATP-binding protein n=1 Tax=Mycobacteroides abscessus TaxID=36809 RepID=UPI0009C97606|nr:ATP-binding protein [Mycobacteroides abscessus]SLG30163.1 Predicted ATPase (AAA+ superfamily) [Mycobacteroides abscessus subsp. abscessus]